MVTFPQFLANAARKGELVNTLFLLRMKLTSFRDKDRVHIRSLDASGLISSEIESRLAPELAAKLRHIRETE